MNLPLQRLRRGGSMSVTDGIIMQKYRRAPLTVFILDQILPFKMLERQLHNLYIVLKFKSIVFISMRTCIPSTNFGEKERIARACTVTGVCQRHKNIIQRNMNDPANV